jgi:hypothetical protein
VEAQRQHVLAFLTQIGWPNWLVIIGASSAISSIIVLLMQG